jgi:hypothetical protein
MSDSTLTIAKHQYLRAFRQLFPTRLLRRAVAAHGRATRDRKLPQHVLLGMLLTWFFQPQAALPAFLRWLAPAGQHCPSEPAVYQARGRLGWAPLRWLREHAIHPLADRQHDGDAFYYGMRLLAIDGTTLTVADTAANVRTFGRPKNQHGAGGYPLARVVALCEVGTHALLDWVIRGYHRSEQGLAARLLRRVPAGTLLLADRNFHSFVWWQQAQAGGYESLLRVQKGPKLPVHTALPDGSYLSAVYPRRGKNKKGRAIVVRVIRYQWTDANGAPQQARLVTSLLDARAHPAAELVTLYHRRWEHELVFKEIKGQLAGRPMQVRAQDPKRVCQEVEALLLGHYLVRWVMLQAARRAGVAATGLSFTGSLRVLAVQLARVPARRAPTRRWWSRWWSELLGEVGRQRLRPRSGRRCPRARKVTRSHWPVKKGQKAGTIPELEIVPAVVGSSP